jgi:hypothetical protein
MQLWSDQYDRQMGELFALEDDIAQAITTALQVRLGGGASLVHRGTTSAEAHDLVLRANGLALQGDEANLNRAIALYQQALAIDSTYAEAWARLAFAYAYVADAYKAPREMVPLAEQAAQRALALDDSLALAHSALGTVRYSWQWRFAEGRHELERALALDPSSPEAHLNYAQYLMAINQDIAGGERELELAAARDPLSPDIVRWQETAALVRGETDRALRLAGRIRELSGSGVYYGFNRTAEAYWAAGRWADCVKASDMDTVSSAPAAAQLFLAICSAHLGNGVVARRLLGRIEAQPYVDQMWRGAILYALGDTTGTLAALSRAIEDRSANILGARSLPWYRGLRHDPRFVALLARMGLPPSGPPRQPAR